MEDSNLIEWNEISTPQDKSAVFLGRKSSIQENRAQCLAYKLKMVFLPCCPSLEIKDNKAEHDTLLHLYHIFHMKFKVVYRDFPWSLLTKHRAHPKLLSISMVADKTMLPTLESRLFLCLFQYFLLCFLAIKMEAQQSKSTSSPVKESREKRIISFVWCCVLCGTQPIQNNYF